MGNSVWRFAIELHSELSRLPDLEIRIVSVLSDPGIETDVPETVLFEHTYKIEKAPR